ncbi:MAG: SDR family oxidoreductase, partial [Kiritimatiellaceae bacterium]|nr:SDR family oxidoreductase [Kiritimatiellaceae bacterium]
MKNQTMIVTGGAQGIGRAVVDHFLALGWNVTAVDVRPMELTDRLEFVQGDTSLEETARHAVSKTIGRFGQVDVLVNNAGVGTRGTFKPEELTLDEWNRVLGINLTGTFLMAKHTAPYLRKTRGLIVNIASTRALMSP